MIKPKIMGKGVGETVAMREEEKKAYCQSPPKKKPGSFAFVVSGLRPLSRRAERKTKRRKTRPDHVPLHRDACHATTPIQDGLTGGSKGVAMRGKHCLAIFLFFSSPPPPQALQSQIHRIFFEPSLQASMQSRGDIAAEVLTQVSLRNARTTSQWRSEGKEGKRGRGEQPPGVELMLQSTAKEEEEGGGVARAVGAEQL